MTKVLIVAGSRAIGMDFTKPGEPRAPLGHMNVDFFIKAFKAMHWDIACIRAHTSNPVISVEDTMAKYKPDLLFHAAGAAWVQKGRLSVPTIFYINDGQYFRNTGFDRYADLVITRHKKGVQHLKRSLPHTIGMKHAEVAYLPFSVAPELLPKSMLTWNDRTPKVAFSANSNPRLYPAREAAANALKAAGLLDDQRSKWQKARKHEITPQKLRECINFHRADATPNSWCSFRTYAQTDPKDYFKYLARFKIALTCASRIKMVLNKDYEIPAVGTVLLTNGEAPDFNRVLPVTYYATYKTPKDAVEKVKRLLKRDGPISAMAHRARKHIMQNHTDNHRINQLRGIIQNM